MSPLNSQNLGKGIKFIEGEKKGKYPFCNCLLIGSCLIDTGAGRELSNLRVDVVINSHWHEDHISRNGIAKKVMVHEFDAEAVESFDEFKERYGLGDSVKIFVNLKFCEVSDTFKDGDTFDFGSNIEVIHTPGHSMGHCCFLIDDSILFLGDIDLSSFGPWYGCHDCDVSDFIKSIERIKGMADDVQLAVPAHGNLVPGEELVKRLDSFLEIIYERERKIKELLLQGINPVGRGIIYRRFPEPKEVFEHFERIMVEKHAQRLGLPIDLE